MAIAKFVWAVLSAARHRCRLHSVYSAISAYWFTARSALIGLQRDQRLLVHSAGSILRSGLISWGL